MKEFPRMALMWMSMTRDECCKVCHVVVLVHLRVVVGRRKSQHAVWVLERLEVCACEVDWENMDACVRWSQSMCCVFSDPLFFGYNICDNIVGKCS
jgi:hypothetical protein